MSGPNNADELITVAEAHGELWTLLVEHDDGRIEAHHTDVYASRVSDLEQARAEIGQWLLVPDPVGCLEAVAAGVELLDACAGCRALYEG
jgi:hypothetical protein